MTGKQDERGQRRLLFTAYVAGGVPNVEDSNGVGLTVGIDEGEDDTIHSIQVMPDFDIEHVVLGSDRATAWER